MRVLIADDEAVIRLGLRTMLQDAGHEVVGAATTGASFGAFFYNTINERQESYVLYALSGVPRESFEKIGLPRNTAIFSPTFTMSSAGTLGSRDSSLRRMIPSDLVPTSTSTPSRSMWTTVPCTTSPSLRDGKERE